ncbi:branched-chain amino acid ABC transporter permease [Hartmannibacter diazotrophicus]|uniref:branched-chain amino acid ABC transporter permease n=1 Tax=Hartmannibacter diazotrophicus TaxID=1482074 RepID=UPI0015703DB3|nr:branched-chain amino acid ABC transporter permease [Hartmannibacter diazotrophicus]
MLLALDTITTASLLFIIATGLLVIFGVLKIINFAHSAFLTLGAYATLVVTNLGINPWIALPLAFVVGALLGAVVERFIVQPLYDRPLDAILATWGLGIVIGQVITLAFGREVQFTAAPISGTLPILGETYSIYRLLLIAAALAIGLGFTALIEKTRLGLSARAVIMNEDLARGLGIDTSLVRLVTFALGAGLAALAGALITPLSSVDPNMGVPFLINAFMVVMVAGTSFLSLALATLVLGAAQVVVSSLVSPILGGMTIVVLAAVILRIRPKGFSFD